jgi:calcium-dependent protein kinase
LLTGLPPFDGETDHNIIAQVAKGVYNMDIPEMENVSNLAKELIVNMLKPDITRLTLDQIFNHPWVYGDKEKSNDLKLNFQRMQSYAKYSKFKKIITNYLVVELTEIEVSELGNLFKKIDINHDGFVDIPELKIALDSQKECKTYAEISKMIKHIDASGKLNYN